MARNFLQAVDFLRPTGEISHLFALDVLLPVQDHHTPADHGLRRLCQALLADALKCLGAHGRDQLEAWDWIISDAEYCFSFTSVCSVLQFDAKAVRSEVRHRFAPGRARPGGVSPPATVPTGGAVCQACPPPKRVARTAAHLIASTSPQEAKRREVKRCR